MFESSPVKGSEIPIALLKENILWDAALVEEMESKEVRPMIIWQHTTNGQDGIPTLGFVHKEEGTFTKLHELFQEHAKPIYAIKGKYSYFGNDVGVVEYYSTNFRRSKNEAKFFGVYTSGLGSRKQTLEFTFENRALLNKEQPVNFRGTASLDGTQTSYPLAGTLTLKSSIDENNLPITWAIKDIHVYVEANLLPYGHDRNNRQDFGGVREKRSSVRKMRDHSMETASVNPHGDVVSKKRSTNFLLKKDGQKSGRARKKAKKAKAKITETKREQKAMPMPGIPRPRLQRQSSLGGEGSNLFSPSNGKVEDELMADFPPGRGGRTPDFVMTPQTREKFMKNLGEDYHQQSSGHENLPKVQPPLAGDLSADGSGAGGSSTGEGSKSASAGISLSDIVDSIPEYMDRDIGDIGDLFETDKDTFQVGNAEKKELEADADPDFINIDIANELPTPRDSETHL
eukprot:g1465.t1